MSYSHRKDIYRYIFFNFPVQFFSASYLYRNILATAKALCISKYVYMQGSKNFLKIQ